MHTGGVKTGLDEALDEVGAMAGGADVVQGVMLDVFGPGDIGDEGAPSPLSRMVGGRRSAGRPKGARNVATAEVKRYLLSMHRHPLQVMMETYGMSPADLAERIGLAKRQDRNDDGEPVGEPYWSNDDLLDLFKLQVRMAEASAAYFVSRAPQAVAVASAPGVNISIGGGVSVPARAGVAGKISGDDEGSSLLFGVQVGHVKSD